MGAWFVTGMLGYIMGAVIVVLSMNFMQTGRVKSQHLPLLASLIGLGLLNFVGGLVVALLRDVH